MYDPIAYTYEADVHCAVCAERRFERNTFNEIVGRDSEGNEIGIIPPWGEWWEPSEPYPQVLKCGTCHGEIDRIDEQKAAESEAVMKDRSARLIKALDQGDRLSGKAGALTERTGTLDIFIIPITRYNREFVLRAVEERRE